VRRPAEQAADRVEHAQSLARAAQSALQELDSKEAAEVSQTWPPRSLTAEERQARRNTEDDLAGAVRTLRTVEAAAQAARKEYDAAVLALGPVIKEVDTAAVAVLVEEGKAAFQRMIEARDIAMKIESEARSIAAALAALERFVEAEKLSVPINTTRWPEPKVDATHYLNLFERLRSDADAELAS
jgi:hypothetical protein